MKLAKVIPLFKSGQKEHCNNYQPILLLPVLSKILEKIVHKRTYNYLSTHEILSKSQFGFRNKHSTTDPLTKFIGDVLEGFDKNMICLSVFTDLKKAFETVNHDIILDKL